MRDELRARCADDTVHVFRVSNRNQLVQILQACPVLRIDRRVVWSCPRDIFPHLPVERGVCLHVEHLICHLKQLDHQIACRFRIINGAVMLRQFDVKSFRECVQPVVFKCRHQDTG